MEIARLSAKVCQGGDLPATATPVPTAQPAQTRKKFFGGGALLAIILGVVGLNLNDTLNSMWQWGFLQLKAGVTRAAAPTPTCDDPMWLREVPNSALSKEDAGYYVDSAHPRLTH